VPDRSCLLFPLTASCGRERFPEGRGNPMGEKDEPKSPAEPTPRLPKVPDSRIVTGTNRDTPTIKSKS